MQKHPGKSHDQCITAVFTSAPPWRRLLYWSVAPFTSSMARRIAFSLFAFSSLSRKACNLSSSELIVTGAISSSSSMTALPIIMSDSLSSSFLCMRNQLAVKFCPYGQTETSEYVKNSAPIGGNLNSFTLPHYVQRYSSVTNFPRPERVFFGLKTSQNDRCGSLNAAHA